MKSEPRRYLALGVVAVLAGVLVVVYAPGFAPRGLAPEEPVAQGAVEEARAEDAAFTPVALVSESAAVSAQPRDLLLLLLLPLALAGVSYAIVRKRA
ncbi:MAG: hypothetical protein ACE5KH_01515 [Candidatus Geothermarchaeales archaeon]